MGDVQVFDYYYGDESSQFSFYRIPRLLIRDKRFKGLSTEAKLLYGLMLDRMGLSAKNGWYDEKGRVYIYYTAEEIREDLCCGNDKALKLLAELDMKKGYGLIERIKQGQGKPTKIYVKRFTTTTVPEPPTLSEVRGADIGFSKVWKNRCLDLDESDALTSEKPTQVILNPIKRIIFILIHPSIHSPPYRPAEG